MGAPGGSGTLGLRFIVPSRAAAGEGNGLTAVTVTPRPKSVMMLTLPPIPATFSMSGGAGGNEPGWRDWRKSFPTEGGAACLG